MKPELSANKKADYLKKIRRTIKDPSYSIFIILGLPFILALLGAIFDPYTLLLILIGPLIALTCYAYYTGNKLSSAILGLLVFPLMFFYAGPIGTVLNFQFEQLGRYFEWTYIFGIIDDFWKYSLAHSLIGFLIAFRKTPYLLLALLVFVLQLMELLSHVD